MRSIVIVVAALGSVVASIAAGGKEPNAPEVAALVKAEEPAPVPEMAVPVEPTFDVQLSDFRLEGAVAEAALALDAGKHALVIRLLQSSDPVPTVRFLRGQAFAGLARHDDALREFEGLGEEMGPLAARVECHRAESLVAARRFSDAVQAWQACSKDRSQAARARIEQAKAIRETGDRAHALQVLEPLREPGARRRGEALALSAELQEAIGARSTALETWRTLYLEEPLSPHSGVAWANARKLLTALDASPVPSERIVERAMILMERRRTHDALATLRAVQTTPVCTKTSCWTACDPDVVDETGIQPGDAGLFSLAETNRVEAPALARTLPLCAVSSVDEPASPVDCKAQVIEGWGALRMRAYAKALPLLESVYARCEVSDVRALALFLASDAAAKLGRPQADTLARILARQFPESSFGDDALLGAAKRALERQAFVTERALLEEIAWHHWEGDMRPEALFRLFWSHRREGHPERGLHALQALSETYDGAQGSDAGDAERGRYWWGRTVAELAGESERAEGVQMLAGLSSERPTTYYGLLARSWLSSHGHAELGTPQAPTPHAEPLRLSALAGTGLIETAAALLAHGLRAQAREVLMGIDREPLRAGGDAGLEASLLVAELLARTGDARMAHHFARRDLLGLMRLGGSPIAHRAAEVAYPLVFRESIVNWGVANGVDPDLMQGLMREESALDPRARSPVGARGLTQVMPATARQVATSIRLRGFKVDDLWEPDTNIRIGTWYFGRMLERFKHPALAAAAYNAGPGNLSKWLARGMPESVDAFVEEIPFDETRGYVKRVLRSYATYGFLSEAHQGAGLTLSTAVVAAAK